MCTRQFLISLVYFLSEARLLTYIKCLFNFNDRRQRAHYGKREKEIEKEVKRDRWRSPYRRNSAAPDVHIAILLILICNVNNKLSLY